ncbi:EH domain-containing protein 1-like [Pempheris klunzingeri]|uniref:EH domain-containing protein 1-like n=1 Tax=Pempheris klunzingeri TaxID=3127111 RepID=UPI0039816CB7
MVSTFRKKNEISDSFRTVADGLKHLYLTRLLPLEDHYKFKEIIAPKLQGSDFDSAPMILLIGQYSTGKTSLIRYLLNADYPGMRIGPEPTTDGFQVIMYGESERIIPGNALVSDKSKQFCSLDSFGNNFLNRFCCSETNNDFLKNLTIVDSPGILAGDKQTVSRGYDFTGVVSWFAERSDLILLLFDAHKLDISDEFRQAIEALRSYDTKIRLILNKADSVSKQQLMRVYGALMWSLGKVIQTPEVTRIYIGSFWDKPLIIDDYRDLFQLEQDDLFEDIRNLPKNAAIRKLNDFIKRARYAIINAHIISALRAAMPMFGKDKKKAELIANLPDIYRQLTRELSLSVGDFPPVESMRKILPDFDFMKFNTLNSKLITKVQTMLQNDIPTLLGMIPQESQVTAEEKTVKGGIFSSRNNLNDTRAEYNPFTSGAEEGVNFGSNSDEWIVNQFRASYDRVFESLPNENGKLSGAIARQELLRTKLPNKVLAILWNLSDVDRDGKLTKDEFALMCYLCKLKSEGHEIPDELPAHLRPPSSF